MKKTLIALAAFGLTGAAVAQSSVTLFGVVDAAVRYTKASGQSLKKLDSSGLNTSRFGVRGTEDLGGGLKAGFWLESEVGVDNGVAGGGNAFWGRRATVSLSGDFGEVRLGRNKTTTRLHLEDFDPYAFTGLGNVGAVYSNLGASSANGLGGGTTLARADNLVSYSLPGNLGGFFGAVDVSAGEGTNTNKGQYGRFGYKDGAILVSAAYGSSSNAADSDKFKLASIGGAYDFGVARPTLSYTETKYAGRKQQVLTAAVTVPLGQGQLIASYTDAKAKGAASNPVGDATLFAVGYVYNLSKRTALYTTYGMLDNDNAAKTPFVITGTASNVPTVKPGDKSQGFDVGIRHSF